MANKGKSEDGYRKIALYKLFSYAERIDAILMIVGSIGAIANGASQPMSTLAFGQLINSLDPSNQTHLLLHQVSKVSLKIFFLAIGAATAGFLQMFCWTVTGERQSARIRGLYLKTILRQEIAFFDTEKMTGEAVGSISEDTKQAMGEKASPLHLPEVGFFQRLLSYAFQLS